MEEITSQFKKWAQEAYNPEFQDSTELFQHMCKDPKFQHIKYDVLFIRLMPSITGMIFCQNKIKEKSQT
jgi:hypothetical protein